jgi:hypothetical protein
VASLAVLLLKVVKRFRQGGTWPAYFSNPVYWACEGVLALLAAFAGSFLGAKDDTVAFYIGASFREFIENMIRRESEHGEETGTLRVPCGGAQAKESQERKKPAPSR